MSNRETNRADRILQFVLRPFGPIPPFRWYPEKVLKDSRENWKLETQYTLLNVPITVYTNTIETSPIMVQRGGGYTLPRYETAKILIAELPDAALIEVIPDNQSFQLNSKTRIIFSRAERYDEIKDGNVIRHSSIKTGSVRINNNGSFEILNPSESEQCFAEASNVHLLLAASDFIESNKTVNAYKRLVPVMFVEYKTKAGINKRCLVVGQYDGIYLNPTSADFQIILDKYIRKKEGIEYRAANISGAEDEVILLKDAEEHKLSSYDIFNVHQSGHELRGSKKDRYAIVLD